MSVYCIQSDALKDAEYSYATEVSGSSQLQTIEVSFITKSEIVFIQQITKSLVYISVDVYHSVYTSPVPTTMYGAWLGKPSQLL